MKKTISMLLAVAMLFGCAVPAFAADETLSVYSSYKIPTGSARMTAHRGYSAVAPENTLPSFRKAGEYGFWGAECDTSPTADGVWVIMHDDTVDRMTDGTGKVNELTYAEIQALTVDAGNNVEQYPDTKVPTLVEYLDVCREFNMHPVIEIKGSAKVEDMDSLAALLSAREEKDRFVIITFESALAAKIKELMPETPVYLLIGGAPAEEFLSGIQFCLDNGLDGIDFACVWGKDMINATVDAGLKTMVWTIDDVKTAEQYYKWGVRDFTTNALTPAKPQGNVFQRVVWKLRDVFYSFSKAFERIIAAGSVMCGARIICQ
ncbi:MAG: hypothetical protein IJK89_02305 [Clostridia bacterium]|nr:hypothetical protein [Clostridia bacterium]